MEYHSLGSTGLQLSVIGLGGSGYGGIYGEYDEDKAVTALRTAIEKGINYIDTSPFYGIGRSEEVIGRALRGVSRDRFYIGTKVGRYQWNMTEAAFDFSAEKTEESIKESLKRLQLEYVDILQVHDLEFAPSIDIIVNETLPAIQRIKDRGLCKFIGITGYPLDTLKEVISRSKVKINCVLTYARLTLNDNSLTESFDFFRSHDIAIINASPLSLGMLTETGPRAWNPAHDEIKEACRSAVQYCMDRGVDITRLAIQYSTGFKEVTTTLIAINDIEMLEKNIRSAMTPLSDHETTVMEEIDQKYFKPLKIKHWENKEVEQYWTEIRKSKNS